MAASLVAVLMLLGAVPQKAPADFATLSRRAAEARDGKRLDEAIALYRKALALKPDWEDGLWSYGSIAYDRDDYKSCAPAFRHLASLKPQDPPSWTMAGLCEYGLKNYEAALRDLLEADRLGFKEIPELAGPGRIHLAFLMTKFGDFERAIVLLNTTRQMHGTTPELIVACGIAGLRKAWLPFEVPEPERDKVFKLGDAMAAAFELEPKGAMEKFEAALRDYPAEPNIHYRFGGFLMQNTPERGIEEIKKALELEPGHVPGLVSLAMIHLKREEPQIALGFAQRAVKTGPGDFSTHTALGRVLLATGDPAGAARALETAMKLAPASPDVRFSLASAYSRLGRKDDSVRELEEFKRLRKLVDSTRQ